MAFGPKNTVEDVIQGCINNERKAQETLYKEFFPAMMSMCYRYTHDPDKAIEIVNNGFLRVFQKIHLFKHEGQLGGWIRKIVFHALSDYFRSRQSSVRFMVIEDREYSVNPSANEQLYYDDLMDLVNGLPRTTKNVFIKYAIEGYNHREIGEIFNISEGTSKWHLNNARKLLKKKLAQQSELNKYAK